MDIQSAYKYLAAGFRIRRTEWARNYFLHNKLHYTNLTQEDVLAEDWEIMTENIIKEYPITYGQE